MIRLQPIAETQSSPQIAAVYTDLKTVLRLKTVPPYFQLIANNVALLEFLWMRLRPLISDPQFQEAVREITQALRTEVGQGVPTNASIQALLPKIGSDSKKNMATEFQELERVNATMLLVTMIIRENVKGLKAKQVPLQQIASGNIATSNESSLIVGTEAQLEQFESSALALSSQDPYLLVYMQLTSELMTEFTKSKEYLALRVKLENLAQEKVKAFNNDFNLYYQEIVQFFKDQTNAPEMLYLLHDAFPAFYPKQLLATIILELGLYHQVAILGNDDRPTLQPLRELPPGD